MLAGTAVVAIAADLVVPDGTAEQRTIGETPSVRQLAMLVIASALAIAPLLA
jgi:hypothetical protein